MGITAISGPFLVYGIAVASTGQVSEYNEERGPSIFDLGQATADPRGQFYGYDPGSAVGTQVKALWDQQGVVDFIPFNASTAAGSGGFNSIAQSTVNAPVAGTALTLNAVSSVGAFRTTIVAPETGLTVSVVAIDSTAATLNFGTGGTVSIWNPAAGSGRALSIINTSNANTEQYIVRGRDMYGFKMTETILASTTSTGTGIGRKAFKYIQSVTPSTATTVSATGVSVGFADVFGLPLYAPFMAGVSVWASTTPNAAGVVTLSSANSVIGSTAVTQTATTPDVRGTIGGQGVSAPLVSNGSTANGAGGYNPTSTGTRYSIYQPITPNVAGQISLTANTSAWFGATQFSDF